MRTLLCIAVVALFAWSAAKGVVEPDWTTRYHNGSIVTVHVFDTLGVSASYRAVYIWNDKTGALLDSIPFPGGQVEGAWISDSGRSIVVFTHSGPYAGCALRWYGWPALQRQDSIVGFFSEQGPASKSGSAATAISRSTNVLSLYYFLEENYGQITNTLTSVGNVDMKRRKLMGPITYSSSFYGGLTRYEGGDSVITNYYPLRSYQHHHETAFPDIPGNGNRSVSATSSFVFDGVSLFDNVRRSFIQRVTRDDWYVVRYGPDDAHVVGLRPKGGAADAKIYELCVVNIVKDSVEEVIDTSIDIEDQFWVDNDYLHVYDLGSKGVLRRWPLASIVQGGFSCRLAAPDTVSADSVYALGVLLMPHEDPASVVVDPGDGRTPTVSSHWSWRTPGNYALRIGVVNNDTSWNYTRTITVLPSSKRYVANYSNELGSSPVVSIDVSNSTLLLVETKSGLTSVLDPELQSHMIRQFTLQSIGASWGEDSTINKFDFYGTEHRTKPTSEQVDKTFNLIGSKLEMASLGRMDTDTITTGFGTYSTVTRSAFAAKILANRPQNTTWMLFAWYPTGTIYEAGGGVYSYNGEAIVDHRFNRPVYKYSDMDYAGCYGNVCVSADGSMLTVLFYNYYRGSANTKFMLVDLLRDSIKSIIPGFYTTDMQSIGMYNVVTDGHWLSLDPFSVAATHPFTGPFAEDAVPDHAIAWKDGWFYSFHPNGRIHDSVQADTMRPTVIRVFKDGRIIAGYASGLVAIYGASRRDLTSVEPPTGESAESFQCWPNPTTSTLHCQLDTSVTLPATFEIFDVQGRLCGATMLESHNADVNLPAVMNMEATGMFVVRVRSNTTLTYTNVVLIK